MILSCELGCFMTPDLKIIKCVFKNDSFCVMGEGIHSVRANILLTGDAWVSWYFHIKKWEDRLANGDAILCAVRMHFWSTQVINFLLFCFVFIVLYVIHFVFQTTIIFV